MSQMQKLVQAVEYSYALPTLKIKEIDAKDGVYRLSGHGKVFCLKHNKYPHQEFLYIYYALEHLASQGEKNFNRIISTRNGKPLIMVDDKEYFLSPWLEGKTANYTKPEQVAQVGTALAKLHQASFGYHPYYYSGRIKWGQNLDILNNKKADLIRFGEIGEKAHSFFDLIYRENISDYLGLLEQARHLMQPVFATVDKNAATKSGFCHHDLAFHNILIHKNRVNFVDFDYAISDTNVHDLASLIQRILKANDFDISHAKLALACYQKELPLTKEEKQMLAAFLSVPQLFWQLGLAYYDENSFHLPENRQQNPKALKKLERRLSHLLAKRFQQQQAVAQIQRFLL